MNLMMQKLVTLAPELTLLIGACLCLAVGLSRSRETRRLAGSIAAIALVGAGVAIFLFQPFDTAAFAAGIPLSLYVKPAVVVFGLLLLLLAQGLTERVPSERALNEGRTPFDPAFTMTGEFNAFFLFSLTGVMLCSGADDLVWLFLALELTSLPTYVMIAISRERREAGEASVKYFFLGAMAAAVFLYGFTMIYGATGYTQFADIRRFVAAEGTSPLLLLGIALSVIGIAFKIAAVPMHFYAADVYQGAAIPVTAMLAFVPKTAGFVALILVLGLCTRGEGADRLPHAIEVLLVAMAVLTMTIGNVLGLLQSNVKRMLAYSSIAHSGYMLVGLLGIGHPASGVFAYQSGGGAVLFYLVAYGVGNLAAFAVLGCLERDGEEAQHVDDLSGLWLRRPALGVALLLACLSLIGLPPMVGFVGKVYLFGVAVSQGFVVVVVVAVVNSAISAVYYLRLVNAAFFGQPSSESRLAITPARASTAIIAATLTIVLGLGGNWLATAAQDASPRSVVAAKPRSGAELAQPVNRGPEVTAPARHH